jgi:radical SAM protein with 4Fe4S-binding SPASM domain
MIISPDDLESQLKEKFNVKLIHDLGKLSATPNGLFKALDSVYQESYNADDRIVFYTSQHLSEQFLQNLYETINFIDISNWFILICGPAELKDLVASSCRQFSTDPIPVGFQEVALGPTHKVVDSNMLPDTICSIPWTNLEIRSTGDITPCCMIKNLSLGNIKTTTLEQAFHSEVATQLRAEFLAGRKPAECSSCWKVEDKNLTSIRMHNIKRTKKDFLTKFLDDPEISTIDLKFNNTCNFKCRVCNGESSSLFALEEHKYQGIPLVLQDNWSESDSFINQMVELLPRIQNIDMFGGEPFLIKKFKKVLELAVDQGHSTHIRLHYNSNGSIWPEQLLPYWPDFKLVDIHFSIDAVEKQFELQRGGSWKDVEANILRIKELNLPNLSISIMPTISIMNVYYIDQVYNWAQQHGFPLFVSHVRGPGVELNNLTKDAKELMFNKFKDHPWNEIQKVLEIIKTLPDSDGAKFNNRVRWFDQIRNENFSENHFEIAKAMGYVYNKNL